MMAPTSIRLATQAELHGLFLEHLFHITDLALHLTTCFFDGTSVAQVWIPRRFAGLFFHFAFRFFEDALDLIFCARFQADLGQLQPGHQRHDEGAGGAHHGSADYQRD